MDETDEEVRFVDIRPAAGYIRLGTVAKTDETEKAEIAGLPCGVRREAAGKARVYVFVDGVPVGPYILDSDEVIP